MKIEKIELKKEKPFMDKTVIFKSLSPCVVREHNDETNRDWFHSLDTDRGKTLFIENLKYQVLESIEDSTYDLEDIKISIIKNKEVKVKHYGIEVLANICVFEMEAKAYILEYFYKAGIGSFKSTGLVCFQLYRRAMMNEIRIKNSDWLFNCGILGLYNILTYNNDKRVILLQDELIFPVSRLENF